MTTTEGLPLELGAPLAVVALYFIFEVIRLGSKASHKGITGEDK